MSTLPQVQSSIQNSSQGLALSELLEQFPEVPRRTMQRWLQKLLDGNQIQAKGQARARRYFPINFTTQGSRSCDAFPSYIKLSADSQDILNYIQQPLSARNPVGYQADLLNDYQPNKTHYLSTPLRERLRKMGDTKKTELPAGTYGRDILGRLMVDLSWASSNLEGNTYSRLDTIELIEHGKVAAGKAAIETQMILNHKAAIEFLVENIEQVDFNRYTFLNLHSLLAENLLANPADEGRVREHIVEIGKSVFQPLSVPSQIHEQLDLILLKASEIKDPYEQAFFIMVYLPYLQPFADINKRTSRLGANLPLIKHNLCPLTFLDVPETAYSRAILGVYELGRVELLRDVFVWAYERSTQEYIALKQELAQPDPLRLAHRDFIKAVIRNVVLSPESDPLNIIKDHVAGICVDMESPSMDLAQLQSLEALIIDELSRLHEGTLARYGLRLSEYSRWKAERAI